MTSVWSEMRIACTSKNFQCVRSSGEEYSLYHGDWKPRIGVGSRLIRVRAVCIA